MNPIHQVLQGKRMRGFVLFAITFNLVTAILLLTNGNARAGGVVTNCTEADLRAAMAGGGTVSFACDGTITLTGTITNTDEVVLDGSGHQVTISGNNAVRVFCNTTNARFTATNLAIVNGGSGGGSGILNLGGTVSLNGVSLISNRATDRGGAMWNDAGEMDLQSCTLACNLVSGAAVAGGAIYNSGTMTLDLCSLTGNMATGDYGGGYGGNGGSGSGGAVFNEGTMTVSRTSLCRNSAVGGEGWFGENSFTVYSGGNALGGGICNSGELRVVGCTLVSNVVMGGAGGGGYGYFDDYGFGPAGPGGYGGGGFGGAIYTTGNVLPANLINCTIAFNTGLGGDGGSGGSIINPAVGYVGNGGNGGNGGSGVGGIYTAAGSGQLCCVTNCTIAGNSGAGGAGGYGGPGDTPGQPGVAGVAWGTTSNGSFFNTLFSSNSPAGIDTFANPRLGPLADNGGPTLTMALLLGSPAIDAGSAVGAPATDQRGVPRPQGAGVDIGAFESQLVVTAPLIVDQPTNQNIRFGSTANFSVLAVGDLPLAYQWFFGTDAIFRATNSALCLTNIQPWQAGAYTVVVTNGYGAATSAPAILTVASEPLITSQPTNQNALIGDTVNLSVMAAGAPPLAYQWFFGTAAIPRATNAALQLTNVQFPQAGDYSVVITNVYGAATSSPARLEVFSPVVEIASETALRVVLGRTNKVVFACDGTINLSNTITIAVDAVLDGSGHQITIRGNNKVPVFHVNPNVTLSVSNLSIKSQGGAIFNAGGTVNLNGVIFYNNTALLGGAIYSASGQMNLRSCYFTDNEAYKSWQSEPTQGALGGAIYNAGGQINLQFCYFTNNIAYIDGVSQAPKGGAIYNASGQMNLQSCYFADNWASVNGASQAVFGGAIYNAGTMSLDLCQLSGNSVRGPGGFVYPGAPAQGSGGAIYNCGQLTIDRTTLNANAAYGGWGYTGPNIEGTYDGGTGGNGADGVGGAIYNVGSLSISRSTLCSNHAIGGSGGPGGGGSIIPGTDMSGNGGNGGNGATGTGGALFNIGSASLVNCTIASNTAQGGSGGDGGNCLRVGLGGNGGGGGNGNVGGVWGSCSFVNCTIVENASLAGVGGAGGITFEPPYAPPGPPPGSPGPSGSASGANPSGSLLNVLLFANTPGGNNTFADPKLGPLADNGGPTLTMALLPGSPAIDAGPAVGAPATDQRGVPRPQGAGVDIGAFECLSSPIFMGVPVLNAANHQMQLSGLTPNPVLTLQASTNLLTWWDATNFLTGSNGVFQCVDPIPGDTQSRFYRLKSGTP